MTDSIRGTTPAWRGWRTALLGGLAIVRAMGIVAQQPRTVVAATDTVARLIDSELAARVQGGFNGAVMVERHGVLILKAGYGFADRRHRVPFTTATIAQIGSLTKQFTAAAIVDLAERGKLRYDDRLTRYIPDLPPSASAITIHQALTHTAGLPEDCGDDLEGRTRADLVRVCLADFRPPPSRHFAYSNVGYSLLAAVVEAASGVSLERYLDERFLAPLALTHTGYRFPKRLQGLLAFGDTGGVRLPPISDRLDRIAPAYWNLKGNGGMQSSADDMYRWYRALMHGPQFTTAMRDALMSPHERRDSTVAYGYGWFVRTGADGRVEQVSHTGSDGVFNAAFVWRPQDGFFFYLVTNSGEDAGAQAAGRVLRRLRER